MSFDSLVSANADVIAESATALIAVAANVLAVLTSLRGVRWIMDLVRADPVYEWDSHDLRVGETEAQWHERHGHDPVDIWQEDGGGAVLDPSGKSWEDYQTDQPDPDWAASSSAFPEADWTMADLQFAAKQGKAGAAEEFERRSQLQRNGYEE
jgi:hypothetical protein